MWTSENSDKLFLQNIPYDNGDPLRTGMFTKPRLWLNPMAAESSPHLYAPHFQDSNTALLPYLRAVLHGGLFPY